MLSDLLVSNLGDPKTITAVKEKIGHIFDEPRSRRADPLWLGLKKAFDLMKQKRKPPSIKPLEAACRVATPRSRDRRDKVLGVREKRKDV